MKHGMKGTWLSSGHSTKPDDYTRKGRQP